MLQNMYSVVFAMSFDASFNVENKCQMIIAKIK